MGCALFGRRKDKVKGDDASQYLMKQGAYSVHPGHPHPFVVHHPEVEKKKIYSFWGGVKYTVILSMLLFWIPPFGQMITGYVGGRKAGSPIKGMMATLIPVIFLFVIFSLYKMNIFYNQIDWLFSIPEAGANAAAGLPLVGKIAQFSTDYIRTFIRSFGFGETWLTPYILTVAFGYVGGVMSGQHRKELEQKHNMPVQPQPQPVQAVQRHHVTENGEEIPVVMGKKPEGWED